MSGLRYQIAPMGILQGDQRMATNDELLQERQEMWHNVTRFTTVGVVLIAVVLLLMLIFLT
jgi:hypothetical protein